MDASALAPERSSPPEAAGRIDGLKKRRDFLAAARARKIATPGFVLQARQRAASDPFADPAAARVGFTASKKVGGAVIRNRAKRRLRALAARVLPGRARAGWDYVLIARAGETAERPFAQLERDLAQAFEALERPPRRRRPS